MTDHRSFFRFQERALGVLWGWGLGSVVAGALAVFSRKVLLRQIGMQAIVWGAIDAALAWFGRRGARAKLAAGATDGPQQAQRFRRILLINAGLDVGYLAAGWAVLRRANGREDRTGMGWGIMIQALFLLVYDSALAWLTGRNMQ